MQNRPVIARLAPAGRDGLAGIRTRVSDSGRTGDRCPWPLDDGDLDRSYAGQTLSLPELSAAGDSYSQLVSGAIQSACCAFSWPLTGEPQEPGVLRRIGPRFLVGRQPWTRMTEQTPRVGPWPRWVHSSSKPAARPRDSYTRRARTSLSPPGTRPVRPPLPGRTGPPADSAPVWLRRLRRLGRRRTLPQQLDRLHRPGLRNGIAHQDLRTHGIRARPDLSNQEDADVRIGAERQDRRAVADAG